MCRGRLALLGVTLSLVSLTVIESAESTRAAQPEPGVRVTIAAPEGYGTLGSPLYVIIENTSNQPQLHFEEWNSWGYGNIEIQWEAEDGLTGTARKVPGSWDRNIPTTITLQPGEALVRQVNFDPAVWAGWPDMPYGTTWKLTATYRAEDDRSIGAWTVEATSPTRSILIR